MLRLLEEHAAHIGPALLVFGAIAWLWLRDLRTQPLPEDAARLAEWQEAHRAHAAAAHTPRRVARLAWIALGLLAGLMVSSVLLYVAGLNGMPQLAIVIWVHVMLATLVCCVAALKLKAIGRKRLRLTLRFGAPLRVANGVAVTSLLLPLLVTGVILTVRPRSGGFAANLHLLVAVWWTALLFAHMGQLWHALRQSGERRRIAAHARRGPEVQPASKLGMREM